MRLLLLFSVLLIAICAQAQVEGGLIINNQGELLSDTLVIKQKIKETGRFVTLYPDSAKSVYKQLLTASEMQHFPYGIAMSKFGLGNVYAEKTNNNIAVKYYQQATLLCTQYPQLARYLAVVQNNMGISYDGLGIYNEASKAFMNALRSISQYPTDAISKNTVLLNLAGTLTHMKQYDRALQYLNGMSASVGKNTDWELAIAILNNKGAIVLLQNKIEESLQYFIQSNVLAKRYHIKNTEADLNIANIYFLKHSYDKALPILENILKDTALNENTIEASILSGKIYMAQQMYQQADRILKRALNNSIRYKVTDKILEAQSALSDLNTEKGDYKTAYNYAQQYHLLKDSIASVTIANNINELETRFRFSEKDRALLTSQLRVIDKENKLKQKNEWILIVSSLVIVLLLLLTALYTRNRHKQRLQQQQIHVLKHQHEIIQLKALMKGEETERARLARELHDGIGGMLVAAKLNLGAVKIEHAEATYNPVIDDVMAMLQRIATEVRRTAHNLMPDVLNSIGLEDAIGVFCDEINVNNNLDIDIQFQGDFSWLHKPATLFLYRIMQELIQNVVKHAAATYMALLVRMQDDKICITIEDNGTGFDREQLKMGSGLYSLTHRIEAMKGNITVMSAQGKGTTVFIEIDTGQLNAFN